jgi:hypothetical protein
MNKGNVWTLLFILALLFVGCRGLHWVASHVLLVGDSKHWLHIDANIISSDIERKSSRISRVYIPLIKYRYTYKDKDYTSVRFSSPSKTTTKSSAKSIADKYYVGKTYKIWMNPSKPEEAIIVRPVYDWSFIILLGGLALVIIKFSLLSLFRVIFPTRRTKGK